MNTRKYPRTLEQAFGPYTSHYIMEEKFSDWDGVWIVIGCVVAVAIVYMCMWGM
jgi:hypothetical protein